MSPGVARMCAYSERVMGSRKSNRSFAIAWSRALLVGVISCAATFDARSDEIVQGVLQLRWGDTPRAL